MSTHKPADVRHYGINAYNMKYPGIRLLSYFHLAYISPELV